MPRARLRTTLQEDRGMTAPLVRPAITSIYKNAAGELTPLPQRMAHCAPDTRAALYAIRSDVEMSAGALRLSDLFRSYEMQRKAHEDYATGKKSAYSPPPGGSMHEAGRAFDIDLAAIRMPLAQFWQIAAKWHVVPIVSQPDSTLSESWHFECRGSHQLVYDYYAAGKATNFKKPAQ